MHLGAVCICICMCRDAGAGCGCGCGCGCGGWRRLEAGRGEVEGIIDMNTVTDT